MKKIVPDPPYLTLVNTQSPSLDADLIIPDALAAASDRLLDIAHDIDAYCSAHAGENGVHKLADAGRSAAIAQALIEHALVRL